MVRTHVVGVTAFVTLGYLWFLLGIAWAPSNKLYQQGLVALLWLPGLLSVFFLHDRLLGVWRRNRVFCCLLIFFLVWAAISSLWSQAEAPLRAFKRILYVALFLAALAVLACEYPERIWQGLAVAFVALALSCLVSLYFFYIRDMHPISARLYGIGQASHPILGAYVMSLVVMWGLQFRPSGWWKSFVWAGLIALALVFIALGQSRGAMLALIIGAVALLMLHGGRVAWIGGLLMMVICWAGYEFFTPFILERGLSYRPEIFLASLDMVLQNPFAGLGVGTDYRVVTSNYPEGFDHSHNGFTHVAIELGIVGVVLWSGLWLSAFRVAWNHRHSREGRLVFGSLAVSLVALQFDASSLWDTPRAEWFVTWLPMALTLALIGLPRDARLRPACIKVS